MNITFVFDRKIKPTAGGVERVTHILSKELSRRGYKISFLSVGPLEWNRIKVDTGFPQHYIDSSSTDFSEEFRRFLNSHNIDALIFQGNHGSVTKALSLAPEGVKKLIVLHNKPYVMHGFEREIMLLSPWKRLNFSGKIQKIIGLTFPRLLRMIGDAKHRRRYKSIVSHTDKFIFLSPLFTERFLKLTPGVDSSKLTAINNPNSFVPLSSEEEKENLVLFVGRLSNPQKNITGFIDIWKRFSKDHPEWKAMIVGDGEDAEFVKRYAEKKKIENLSFEGNVDNIEEYYKRGKMLCVPSAYEGWGMILLEAMAYGCVPLVYETYEAVRDVIDNGENGFVVKPFSVRQMVERMNLLVADEPLRKKMAERGKEKIGKFEVGKIADSWETLLNAVQ